MQGYGTEDFQWKTIGASKSDHSRYSEAPVTTYMLDLQEGLELMQNYQRHAHSPDEYMVSPIRSVRRRFQEANVVWEGPSEGNVQLAWRGGADGQNRGEFDNTDMGWRLKGMEELAREFVPKEMIDLERMRKEAADTVPGMYWKMYADNEKDLPIAQNVDELREQLKTISEYHDRNSIQIGYLQQKATVRWEMGIVDTQGFSEKLYDSLETDAYSLKDGDSWASKTYQDPGSTLFGMEGFMEDEVRTEGDQMYSATHWGLLPFTSKWDSDEHYNWKWAMGDTGLGVRHIPSWYNTGEGLVPDFLVPTKRKEKDIDAINAFITASPLKESWEDVPEDERTATLSEYEDIIKQYGDTLQTSWDTTQSQKESDRADNLAAAQQQLDDAGSALGDPYLRLVIAAEKAKDSPEEQARRLENTYFTKHRYERIFKTGKWHVIKGKRKQPERSGQEAWQIKQDRKYKPRNSKQLMAARMQQARDDAEQEKVEAAQEALRQQSARDKVEIHKKATGLKSSKDFTTHFVSGDLKGQEITYERWKQQAANFFFEPSHIGETSWQHAAESILFSDAWIPKDVPLSEENFPSSWIDSRDEWDLWKPLLEHIDKIDDPAMKQRANYIHNIIGQKETEQYLTRFHPHQTMDNNTIGKDLAGTHAILSDDWSLPYKPHMNSVMFNHEIHSQLDVGVVETY
jgi:hypothetical protein